MWLHLRPVPDSVESPVKHSLVTPLHIPLPPTSILQNTFLLLVETNLYTDILCHILLMSLCNKLFAMLVHKVVHILPLMNMNTANIVCFNRNHSRAERDWTLLFVICSGRLSWLPCYLWTTKASIPVDIVFFRVLHKTAKWYSSLYWT